MPYINSSGAVVDNRPKLSFSYITDFFWMIVNTVCKSKCIYLLTVNIL